MTGIDADRIKAVFNTDKGVYGYNKASDSLSEMRLQSSTESAIEIINSTVDDDWEAQLLQCRLNAPGRPVNSK